MADKFGDTMEKVTVLSVFGLVVTLVLGIIFCFTMMIVTPDTWEYCYISKTEMTIGHYYTVEASNDWGSDPTIGRTETLEEAEKLAAANGCPIHKAP
jgi:hypothetical protein